MLGGGVFGRSVLQGIRSRAAAGGEALGQSACCPRVLASRRAITRRRGCRGGVGLGVVRLGHPARWAALLLKIVAVGVCTKVLSTSSPDKVSGMNRWTSSCSLPAALANPSQDETPGALTVTRISPPIPPESDNSRTHLAVAVRRNRQG